MNGIIHCIEKFSVFNNILDIAQYSTHNLEKILCHSSEIFRKVLRYFFNILSYVEYKMTL